MIVISVAEDVWKFIRRGNNYLIRPVISSAISVSISNTNLPNQIEKTSFSPSKSQRSNSYGGVRRAALYSGGAAADISVG